jgi:hypothetical protein
MLEVVDNNHQTRMKVLQKKKMQLKKLQVQIQQRMMREVNQLKNKIHHLKLMEKQLIEQKNS